MFNISIVQIRMYIIYDQMHFTILQLLINIAQSTILQLLLFNKSNQVVQVVFDERGKPEHLGKIIFMER